MRPNLLPRDRLIWAWQQTPVLPADRSAIMPYVLTNTVVLTSLWMLGQTEGFWENVLVVGAAFAISGILIPAVVYGRNWLRAPDAIYAGYLEGKVVTLENECAGLREELAKHVKTKGETYDFIVQTLEWGRGLIAKRVTTEDEYKEWKQRSDAFRMLIGSLRDMLPSHEFQRVSNITYDPTLRYAHKFNDEHAEWWIQLNEAVKRLDALADKYAP